MKCVNCGRTPDQIKEYIELGHKLKVHPTIAVEQEDATYDPETHYFCCGECFELLGNPRRYELMAVYKHTKKREADKK